MCLPYQFLKCILVPSTICILAISLVPILSVVVYHKKGELYISYNEGLIIGGSESLILFTIGLVGLFSYLLDKKYLMGCYCFFLVLLDIGFIIILVLNNIDQHSIQAYTISDCNNSKFGFAEIAVVDSQAQQQFCSTQCICYIQNGELTPSYLSDYNITSTDILSDVVKFQNCPFQGYTSVCTNMLQYYEETYQCAGWCQPSPIYLFSNVNNGIPKYSTQNLTCFNYYLTDLQKLNIVDQWITFSLSLFISIILVLTGCYCYHPDRNKAKFKMYFNIKYSQTL